MKTKLMWLGVGDCGQTKYWPSLSATKMDCKRNILEFLYMPLGDAPNWSNWEFIQVEIRFVEDASFGR